jgi:predicted nucleic acid-binding protein
MPKSKFCWDACIFIAHLKGELRSADEDAGLREVWELFRTKQASILTSSVITSEVLNRAADQAMARTRLKELLKRPGFSVIDANMSVADKAGELRERVNESNFGENLKRNDAIYLATAVLYKVDAFHTFDHFLLSLDSSALVDRLSITKPRGVQTTLAL